MFWASALAFACALVCVSCAPQRYWAPGSSEESDEFRPLWLTPRRSAYPQAGSFSDELTRALDDLQKSILTSRVGAFPVFSVSSSTDDEDEDDSNTKVSISGTGLGSGFASFFSNLGGFPDIKDMKNKTTVKTEIVNGRKVTVKESTYVSDNDGFKSVIHLSEVDMGEPDKTDSSTPKADKEGGESDENKPKEETTTSKSDEKTEEPALPESPEVSTKSSTEKETETENDEDNETVHSKSVEKTNHPDTEVEEIETFNKNKKDYFNYNTIGKLKTEKEVGK